MLISTKLGVSHFMAHTFRRRSFLSRHWPESRVSILPPCREPEPFIFAAFGPPSRRLRACWPPQSGRSRLAPPPPGPSSTARPQRGGGGAPPTPPPPPSWRAPPSATPP